MAQFEHRRDYTHCDFNTGGSNTFPFLSNNDFVILIARESKGAGIDRYSIGIVSVRVSVSIGEFYYATR